MEQRLVEMVAVAVVAEVEPEHGEAASQELRGGQPHVARLGAAFPAVQQQRQPARLDAGHHAVHALQAHAFATVDQMLAVHGAGRRQQFRAAATTPRTGPSIVCRCGLRSHHGAWYGGNAGIAAAAASNPRAAADPRKRPRACTNRWRPSASGQLAIAATMRSRAHSAMSRRPPASPASDRFQEVHFRATPRFAEQAQEVAQEVFSRLERDAHLGIAAYAIPQRDRLHRRAGFDGGQEDAGMERADRAAVARAALRKHGHRMPGAQAREHRVQHAAERFGTAALMEDRFRAPGHPADHRPGLDFALGDEAHHPLAVQHHDVGPADMVGDEQHRAWQWRADAMQSKAEHAHQSRRPGADQAVFEPLAARDQLAGERRDQQDRHRQCDQYMP